MVYNERMVYTIGILVLITVGKGLLKEAGKWKTI